MLRQNGKTFTETYVRVIMETDAGNRQAGRERYGCDGEAEDSGGRGEIRCGVHVQRRRPQGRRNRHGFVTGLRHLSQFCRGRPLHQPPQGSADQPLLLRLRILRKPPLPRGGTGSLRTAGTGGPDLAVLPAQLHRGPVPQLRRMAFAGPYVRADAARPGIAAPRVRVRRLYPRQSHSRCGSAAY